MKVGFVISAVLLFLMRQEPNVVEAQDQASTPACGCENCTTDVLSTYAGQYTCGGRINWLQTSEGGSFPELAACRKIADAYPGICGPACDPDLCDYTGTPAPITPFPTQSPPPQSPLYCFPSDRTTYDDVWGFIVEVKEGDSCGPEGNKFSRNTVSLS